MTRRSVRWVASFGTATHLPAGWELAEAASGVDPESCDYLIFTPASRDLGTSLVARAEALVASARESEAALVADEAASLSFGGLWSPRPLEGEAPVPAFPSPAAYVVEAAAYALVGGVDFELRSLAEVDLAWRLALAGRSVRVVPSPARRESLADAPAVAPRDSLGVLYKCLSDAWLSRVFPWSIALALWRGEASRFESVVAWAEGIRSWERRRAATQARRVVSDEDLRAFFPDPLAMASGSERLEDSRLASRWAEELGLYELTRGTTPGGTAPVPVREGLESPSHPRPPAASSHDVTAVVVTATGPGHIEACLRSLARQRFPRERLEVIAVDNGSAVDPASAVEESFPGARFLRLDTNTGFTGGNNAAAWEATGEFLAFLNDDVVVEPDWLEGMLDVARRRGAAAVAAPVYSWSGRRVDFAAGAVNFEGKGFQLGHGRPKWLAPAREAPVLFACGAGMIVRRDVFLELGGFDPAFFAYYEDVALGWQLWLRGHEIWLAPEAPVRHRQHASGPLLSDDLRTKLYERNALSIVFTHLETANRARALTASLLLLAKRAVEDGAASRARAQAEALDAWMRELPAMAATRRAIEANRKLSDRALLSRFASHWTHPARPGRAYRRYHDALVAALELEAIALGYPDQRHKK